MSEFRSNDVSLRIQKKLLGKVVKKSMVKVWIDDTSSQLLDNLHKLAKHYSNSKKDAEKVVKNIIKIIIKIGILSRNHQFSEEESKIGEEFKEQFHSTAMAIVSFHEVDFSYDRNYLVQSINKCKLLLKHLVNAHLSEKSLDRIDYIFAFFTREDMLDQFFREKNGVLYKLRSDIVNDMNVLLENGSL